MLHSTLGSRLKKVCILFLNGFSPANDLSLGQSDQSPSTNQIRSDQIIINTKMRYHWIKVTNPHPLIHREIGHVFMKCCCLSM